MKDRITIDIITPENYMKVEDIPIEETYFIQFADLYCFRSGKIAIDLKNVVLNEYQIKEIQTSFISITRHEKNSYHIHFTEKPHSICVKDDKYDRFCIPENGFIVLHLNVLINENNTDMPPKSA